MAQKIDSEKLSQLAGQPVEITVQDGETLEQAEARVMQQNPDVFKAKDLATEMTGFSPEEKAGLKAALQSAYEAGDTKEINRIEKIVGVNDKLFPEPKPKELPDLSKSADVKKYINNLVAANNANRTLSNVEEQKKKISTGPFISDIFDASVPRYDHDANLIPPDFIDKMIILAAPEKTKNMRQLDAAIQAMSDFAFEKGGKNLTGTEKTAIFNRQPTRFDNDSTFKEVINQSRNDLSGFTQENVRTLEGLGFDKEAIQKLVLQSAAPGQQDTSYLQSMLQPKVAEPTQPQPQVVDPRIKALLEEKARNAQLLGGGQQ